MQTDCFIARSYLSEMLISWTSSQFCNQTQLLCSSTAPNSVICVAGVWCAEKKRKAACSPPCNQLEDSKKTDTCLVKQILYLMPHTLPLRYSKAGQGQPGHDNLHSILCLDEGRNPVGGVYSIYSSFLSCLLAQHNAFIRETGSAATTRMPTAGLQACAHLYWDEGLFSRVWGDTAAPHSPHKHRGVLLDGLCWGSQA